MAHGIISIKITRINLKIVCLVNKNTKLCIKTAIYLYLSIYGYTFPIVNGFFHAPVFKKNYYNIEFDFHVA